MAAGKKVTVSVVAVDGFSAQARKMARSMKAMTHHMKRNGETAKRIREQYKKLGDTMKKVGRGVSIVGASIVALAGVSIAKSSEIETLEATFRNMMGSAEDAKAMMKDLVDFTARTPFQMTEVMEAGRQLMNFGVEADQVQDHLRRIGDMAAAGGKPITELAFIFGKLKSKGRMTMEEMNQLQERGIPVSEMLKEKYKMTGAQLSKAMQQGKMNFTIFNDLFMEMTSKGGKYYGMTEELAKTTGGLWSTTKDNLDLVFIAIGDILIETLDLRGVMKALISFMGGLAVSIRAFAKENPKVTKLVLAFAAMVVVLGPLLILVGGFLTALPLMALGWALVAGASWAAMLPVLAYAAAVVALVAVLSAMYAYVDEISRAIYSAVNAIVDILPGARWVLDKMGVELIYHKDAEARTEAFRQANPLAVQSVAGMQPQEKGVGMFAGTLDINVAAPPGAVESLAFGQGKGMLLDVGVGMQEDG